MKRSDWLHTEVERIQQAISDARAEANFYSGDGNNYLSAREAEERAKALENDLEKIRKEVEIRERRTTA